MRAMHRCDTASCRAAARRFHSACVTTQIHLDSSGRATIDALVRMASADLLFLGGSGFSAWAGILSCGVKASGR